MIGTLIFVAVLFFLGSRSSDRPIGCLGAIVRAAIIVVLASIAIAFGFVGFFPF